MIPKKLQDFLDSNAVKYRIISHSQAFTAQEIAAIAHIPGKELAKTVMVKADGKMIMAVIPSLDMVDTSMLRKALGASRVELATEAEFKNLFEGCEVGAMPPFGNLYGIGVWVADDLTEDEEIVFNGGSHHELVRMPYKDFERLVEPKIARFSVGRKAPTGEDWKYAG